MYFDKRPRFMRTEKCSKWDQEGEEEPEEIVRLADCRGLDHWG